MEISYRDISGGLTYVDYFDKEGFVPEFKISTNLISIDEWNFIARYPVIDYPMTIIKYSDSGKEPLTSSRLYESYHSPSRFKDYFDDNPFPKEIYEFIKRYSKYTGQTWYLPSESQISRLFTVTGVGRDPNGVFQVLEDYYTESERVKADFVVGSIVNPVPNSGKRVAMGHYEDNHDHYRCWINWRTATTTRVGFRIATSDSSWPEVRDFLNAN
jgi:hypothetical protein